MRLPLYVTGRFSLVAFNILSLSLLSQCILPWVYPAWDSMCLWNLVDYILSHVREIFSY